VELLKWDIFSEKFEEVQVSLGRLDFRLGRLECLLAVVLVAIVAIEAVSSAGAHALPSEEPD
jgi:hypothetical protein